MSDISRIAKNCICGACIGIAVCVSVAATMSEHDCKPVSFCHIAVPHMPHGPEPENAPSPTTGKVNITIVSSVADAGLSIDTLVSPGKTDN